MHEVLWLIAITGLVVVLLIVVFFLLLRKNGEEGDISTGGGPPGALYERYVSGEITIDQYQDQRKEMVEHTPETIVEKFSRFL